MSYLGVEGNVAYVGPKLNSSLKLLLAFFPARARWRWGIFMLIFNPSLLHLLGASGDRQGHPKKTGLFQHAYMVALLPSKYCSQTNFY